MTGWRNAFSSLHAREGRLESAGAPETRAFAWLLVLGAFCKGCYLATYLDLPFLFGPLFDSQVYLLQARRIAEGHFGDPTLLAFSPLYGYFLALLGAHQGSILPVLVQFVLGLLNLVLLRQITARLFGEPAALIAAACYLGYGPLLFFETKIMSETLGVFLLLLSLALIYRPSFARGTASICCAAGVTMALAVLTRASLLPTVPCLAASLWLCRPDEPSDLMSPRPGPRVRRTLWFSLALMLVLCAHGGFTRWHSGLFVPVILVSNTAARATQQTWTGDLSVFRGAHEESVGAFSVVDQARARLVRKRRGEPEPAAELFSVGGYLTQVPAKLRLTLRDHETSFDYGYYGERTEAWPLRLLPVSFGLLLVLGGIGFAGALRNKKVLALAPLSAVAVGTLLTTTLFHPSTRYRLPLLVILLPLAGYAWQLALSLRSQRLRRGVIGALSTLCLGFAIRQAVHPLDHPALWQLRVAEAAVEEGNFAVARVRIAAAYALAPHDPQVGRYAERLTRRLPVPAATQ